MQIDVSKLSLSEWDEFEADFWAMPPEARKEAARAIAPTSTYFLMRFALTTKDIKDAVTGVRQITHPFVYEGIHEMDEDPSAIDIWARGHWKSSTKSFGKPIRRIIENPNVGICIFSCQRKLSRAHMSRLKQEMEGNKLLLEWWPDIFYKNPNSTHHGSPLWSLESGLIVKRSTNRVEATVEAHAFLESLPTGKHYDVLIYDDVVDEDSCRTANGRDKLIEQHKLSLNLVNRGYEAWYVGTHYHSADLYVYLEEEDGMKIRRKPCVDTSKPAPEGEYCLPNGRKIPYAGLGGEPVFLTKEELAQKLVQMRLKVFGQQMMCDPRAGEANALDIDKVRYYNTSPIQEGRGKTRYLLVDPANQTKKESDSSAYLVVALGADQNFYILDIRKGKWNPRERIQVAMELHRMWGPLQEVRWEQTGLESDTFYLEEEQEKQGYRFHIEPLAQRSPNKQQRLADIFQPLLEEGRIYLPREILQPDQETGELKNMVREFVNEELMKFPLTNEDHLMDAFALLFHKKAADLVWPASGPRRDRRPLYDRLFDSARRGSGGGGTWMTA